MIKKVFLLLVVFLISFNLANALFYNSSYTNITLDNNGWCTNIPIEFHIYNSTDYENRDEIKKNLCDSEDECAENNCALDQNKDKDECENCDDCLYFNIVKDSNVKIYDGSIEGLPLLYDEKVSDGSFTYTFERPDNYLIQIITEENDNGNKVQGYNDYQDKFFVKECKVKKKSNVNFDYLDGKVVLVLKNTTVKKDDILVKDNVKLLNNKEDSINTIGITSQKDDFDAVDVKFNLLSQIDDSVKIFKYDSDKDKWNEIEFFEENDYLVINNSGLGYFSIMQNITVDDIEGDIVNNTSTNDSVMNDGNISNEDNNQTIKQTVSNGEIDNSQKRNSLNMSMIFKIMIGIILVVLLFIILYFKFFNKKEIDDNSNLVEGQVLSTYDQVYKKTKEYVQKYKNDYTSDQIYRALEPSEIPKDIINKVFEEEF